MAGQLYAPPAGGTSEAKNGNEPATSAAPADVPVDLPGPSVPSARTTISPLIGRDAAPSTKAKPVVEDRLTGEARRLPAPPSHRAKNPAPSIQAPPVPPSAVPKQRPDHTGRRIMLTKDVPTATTEISPLRKRTGEHATVVVAPTEDPHGPYDDLPDELVRPRRGLQLVLLVGAAVAVGVVGFFTLTQGNNDDGSSETVAGPLATAELLSDGEDASVDVALAASASLDAIQQSANESRLGSPGDSEDGFRVAVESVAGDLNGDTTDTTVWVEPPIPPESEWVDGGNGVLLPDILLRIRFCESTNNYVASNGVSTARGAYQFLIGSWDWYGHRVITGVEQAHLATPAQQDEAALRTLVAEGSSPWLASRPCWSDPDLDPRYATAQPPAAATTTTTVPADPEDTTTTVAEETDPDGEETDPEETTTTTVAEEADSEETTTTVEGG